MAKKGYPKIDLTIPDPAQAESEYQRKLAESAAAQKRAEAREQASAAAQAQRQQAWASQAAGSTALSGRMPTATYAAFTGGYNGNPQTTMQQRGDALTEARYSNGASDSWTQGYEGFLNAQNAGNAIAGERYHPINPETPWTQGYTGGTPTNATGGNVELTPVQPTYGENIGAGNGVTPTVTPTETPTTGVPETSTGGTVTPMTYAQYAEQQRQAQYNAAAQSRQNALVQNAATYQQGLSTYGSRADSLGRMGLQGSGYADYLSGQAYVAKVNADSAARAVEAQAQQQAQAQYTQYINQKREEGENMILEMINSGQTPSDIAKYAEQMGLSDSAYVQMARDTYDRNVEGSISADWTDEYINSLDYDEPQKEALKAKRDEKTLASIFTDTATFDEVSNAITAAQANGTLTEDGVKSAWYSAYRGKIDNLHFDNPNAWTLNDIYSVEKEIEAAFKNGQLTKPDRESALAYLYGTAGGKAERKLEINYDKNGEPNGLKSPNDPNAFVLIKKNAEDSGMSRRLNYIATGSGDNRPEDGTLARLGDDYYVVYNGEWRYIKSTPVEHLFIKSTPTAPDHQP